MMSNIGAQGTNAHTWFEETVYEEDIPSNAMDKFLIVQAERFRKPVFRIISYRTGSGIRRKKPYPG